MTFRLFIFYCSLCGAWAAFVGWALGRLPTIPWKPGQVGFQAMCLGLFVALALGLVDVLWNFSIRQIGQLILRVAVVVVVGSMGGLIGGVIGQALYGWTQWSVFFVFGWTITGCLIGASVGTFDWLQCVGLQRDQHGALRKIINGVLGGTLGGILGSILYLALLSSFKGMFKDKPEDRLWSPSAYGLVVLGACIGLLIGLAQVILKEAWVKVEAGFRKGRELMLSKPVTTIGRAESCDIGLFGDPAIERLHARILLQGGHYLVADAGSSTGTFVNDRRAVAPTPLHAGDEIRLGNCVLRFGERRKRT
jgi:hypothetical protein